MVARKYTAKRLYSGGSNNKKEQLQTSINELLTQLDVSSNEPYIKALRAALLFIQSAIESKTITKQQKKQSNEIAKNLNTTKPSSNNKSSNMGSQITELFKPKNLSMNKAAKVVSTAESEVSSVANPQVASNINIKTNLQSMFNQVTQTNKNNLMNELDTVDLNKDSIKGLFTGKDKNEQLKLLATLLQLTGKDISQVGGTNKSSSSSSFKNNFSSTSAANAGFSGPGGRQAFAETLGNKFFGQPPSKSENTSEAKKSGTPKPIPFLASRPKMNPQTAFASVLDKIKRKESESKVAPPVSNVPLSVSNEPSKSSNNNKKQQMINNLKSILTPEFIKELVAMISSQTAGGKTKSKKNKRRNTRKKHVNRRNKRSNKKK